LTARDENENKGQSARRGATQKRDGGAHAS
jgi:hypothetical protein